MTVSLKIRTLIAAIIVPIMPVGAAGLSLNERMILAHEAYVITFDADTVVILGTTRRARMHIYLPKADDDGFVRYSAAEEVDCTRGLYRYTASTGEKGTGASAEAMPDRPAFAAIVPETPISILRDHLCQLTDVKRGVYGVALSVPGADSARAVFALLKLGLDAKPTADLASQAYGDPDTLNRHLERNAVKPAQREAVIAALGPLVEEDAKPPPPIVPLAAAVASGRAGQYIHGEMELVAGLWLKLDGTFQYGLTVGSLDETARGTWSAAGNRITLIPDPMPGRSNVAVASWRVSSNGRTLTIGRDGTSMVFARRPTK